MSGSVHARVLEATRQPVLLVVDDVEDNREMLTARLAVLGYSEVVTAASGREALDLIYRRRFDLVLLDVMMPGMDGVAVLEQLRDGARLADLPVIMVSALSELERVVRCIELGAEDYLTKPINVTLLRARVAATLEKKQLRDHVREATRAQLQQLDRELMAARALQLSMVPADLETPDLPATVHALLQPARHVGGDLCDFFVADGGALWFVVGDVSGKAAAAALFMARTWSTLRAIVARAEAAGQGDPGAILVAANQALCEANETSMFTTLVAGRLQLETGRLEFANAGHLPPLHLQASGTVRALEFEGRLPLGAMPDTVYPTRRIELAPGDAVFVYSDGITEASGPDGQYSEQKLLADLAEIGSLPGREMLSALLGRVRGAVGDAALEDDFTALLQRWRPVP